mgnify:CR=1 FL=1
MQKIWNKEHPQYMWLGYVIKFYDCCIFQIAYTWVQILPKLFSHIIHSFPKSHVKLVYWTNDLLNTTSSIWIWPVNKIWLWNFSAIIIQYSEHLILNIHKLIWTIQNTLSTQINYSPSSSYTRMLLKRCCCPITNEP